MSYTVIPLGISEAIGSSILSPNISLVQQQQPQQQPVKYQIITQQPTQQPTQQQPSQYPNIIDLRQAYSNSVQQNLSPQYIPNQFNLPQFNQGGGQMPQMNDPSMNGVKVVKNVPTEPKKAPENEEEYEPKSTGCCGRIYDSNEYFEEEDEEEEVRKPTRRVERRGGCCGGMCCGDDEEYLDEYYEKERDMRNNKETEKEFYEEGYKEDDEGDEENDDEDQPTRMQPTGQLNYQPQNMPGQQRILQMMPLPQRHPNLPYITTIPANHPLKINGATVIPLSNHQSNVRFPGNVSVPLSSVGNQYVQGFPIAPAPRYILG